MLHQTLSGKVLNAFWRDGRAALFSARIHISIIIAGIALIIMIAIGTPITSSLSTNESPRDLTVGGLSNLWSKQVDRPAYPSDRARASSRN
jgi:hypothetical protein